MGSLSKIGQLLILALLFGCGSVNAAIARTQAVSANANTVAISSTTANDTIIVFAYRSGSNTAPSLPAGYTNLASTGSNSNAARLGYKVSSGGETSPGTWTNATQVIVHVYSGLNTSTPATLNGNALATSAGTTTMAFNSFTMTAAGSSWIAGFGGASSATAGMNGNTTNLTSRTNLTTACGLDSGAALGSWATETFTFTTSSTRISIGVELLAAASTQSATNGFFLWHH